MMYAALYPRLGCIPGFRSGSRCTALFNICTYIARNRPETVLQRFQLLGVDEVAMSVITHKEQNSPRCAKEEGNIIPAEVSGDGPETPSQDIHRSDPAISPQFDPNRPARTPQNRNRQPTTKRVPDYSIACGAHCVCDEPLRLVSPRSPEIAIEKPLPAWLYCPIGIRGHYNRATSWLQSNDNGCREA
jgi:hypothetical protein